MQNYTHSGLISNGLVMCSLTITDSNIQLSTKSNLRIEIALTCLFIYFCIRISVPTLLIQRQIYGQHASGSTNIFSSQFVRYFSFNFSFFLSFRLLLISIRFFFLFRSNSLSDLTFQTVCGALYFRRIPWLMENSFYATINKMKKKNMKAN